MHIGKIVVVVALIIVATVVFVSCRSDKMGEKDLLGVWRYDVANEGWAMYYWLKEGGSFTSVRIDLVDGKVEVRSIDMTWSFEKKHLVLNGEEVERLQLTGNLLELTLQDGSRMSFERSTEKAIQPFLSLGEGLNTCRSIIESDRSITGTWRQNCDDPNYCFYLTFNADGTGIDCHGEPHDTDNSEFHWWLYDGVLVMVYEQEVPTIDEEADQSTDNTPQHRLLEGYRAIINGNTLTLNLDGPKAYDFVRSTKDARKSKVGL